MIISSLTGGLGNQMFQYAFGRYLSIKNNTELKLHFTNALFNTQYTYGLDVFNIKAEIATDKDLKKINVFKNRAINRLLYLFDERFGLRYNKHIVTQKYPHVFDPIHLVVRDNSYIQGFWQDDRYFKGVDYILRKEFTPKNKLDIKNQEILEHIKETQSISIHVRRGDYITNKTNAKVYCSLGLEYYTTSIKKIKKIISNPIFFVFSDDIPWCKESLTHLVDDIHYIDNNRREAYKDLLLMSACKHNIIANSTFSWWGGWLNRNSNKIVISPN